MSTRAAAGKGKVEGEKIGVTVVMRDVLVKHVHHLASKLSIFLSLCLQPETNSSSLLAGFKMDKCRKPKRRVVCLGGACVS